MKCNRRFRIILTAILCIMMYASASMIVHATGKTQNDAVDWACARGNESWRQDVDGAYGCQCVDLILAYYNYLEGWHTSGNAKDYTWNTLPSGWVRVYSNPQPGDVIVWGAGAQLTNYLWADATYGHIGIVWRLNASGTVSTIETNVNGKQNAGYYERYKTTAACFIRPNFAGSSGTGTQQSSTSSWTVEPVDAKETDAFVSARFTAPSAVQFQWAGCNFFDASGKEIAKAGENTSIYGTYINIFYDITKETWTNYVLTPGTEYKYQFYVTYDSVDHFSPMYSFKTAGSKPHTVHTYKLTSSVKATCTTDGKEIYTCSYCKNSYTKVIPATGHQWNNGVVTKTATAVKDGVKTFTCKVCRATKTQTIPATGNKTGGNPATGNGKQPGVSQSTSVSGQSDVPESSKAQKKTKLSKTTVKLKIGKSTKISIKNAGTSKVVWSTANKRIVTIKASGTHVKITGKKAGTCKITAKVNGKKYVCKVTVKKK